MSKKPSRRAKPRKTARVTKKIDARALEKKARQLEQRTKELARAEALNSAILQSFGEPLVLHDAQWRFQYINEPAMEIFRTSTHHLPSSLIGQNLWELYPDIVAHEFGINLQRAMTERVPLSFEAYYPHRAEWSELRCYPVPSGGLVTVWKNVTDRRHAEEAQRYLAQASAILGSSLDYQATLAALARCVVPELADWTKVDMLESDGSLRVLAVAHVDPEKVKWAEQLSKKYPPQMSADTGLPNVLRTGKAEMYPEITEEMLAAGAQDAEHLALLKTVQLRGVILAPIVSVNGVLGALTLVSAE